jgi:hypothetical protein
MLTLAVSGDIVSMAATGFMADGTRWSSTPHPPTDPGEMYAMCGAIRYLEDDYVIKTSEVLYSQEINPRDDYDGPPDDDGIAN